MQLATNTGKLLRTLERVVGPDDALRVTTDGVEAPLRTEVLVHEQAIAVEMEWDEHDACALHCVAVNRLGMALATGRLLQHAPGVARIGRMAVKKPMRGSDLGARVLHTLIEAARQRGDTQVLLHAQCSAEGFYSRAGFVPQGPVFEEAGIAHIEMVKAL